MKRFLPVWGWCFLMLWTVFSARFDHVLGFPNPIIWLLVLSSWYAGEFTMFLWVLFAFFLDVFCGNILGLHGLFLISALAICRWQKPQMQMIAPIQQGMWVFLLAVGYECLPPWHWSWYTLASAISTGALWVLWQSIWQKYQAPPWAMV